MTNSNTNSYAFNVNIPTSNTYWAFNSTGKETIYFQVIWWWTENGGCCGSCERGTFSATFELEITNQCVGYALNAPTDSALGAQTVYAGAWLEFLN